MNKYQLFKGKGVDKSYRLFYCQEKEWGGSIKFSENPEIRKEQINYFKGNHDISIDKDSYIAGDVILAGDLELINSEINNVTNDMPVKISGQFDHSLYTRDLKDTEILPVDQRQKHYQDGKYTTLNGTFRYTTIDDHSNSNDDKLMFTQTPLAGVDTKIDRTYAMDCYFRLNSQGTTIEASLLCGIKSYGKIDLNNVELDWAGMSYAYPDSRVIVVDSTLTNVTADARSAKQPLSFVECQMKDKTMKFEGNDDSMFYQNEVSNYGLPYLNSLMNEIKLEYGIEDDSHPAVGNDDLLVS